MNIAVDIRALQSAELTGVGIYTRECLLAMIKTSPQHAFCLFYSGRRPLNSGFLSRLSEFGNCRLAKISWPNKLLNFCFYFFNLPKIEDYCGPSDVFWFPNLNLWSLKKSTPLVLTVHDLSFVRYPEFFSVKMRLWHWLTKPAQKLKQARGIIAVSQNTKNDLQEVLGLNQEKIEVIYPGITPNTTEQAEKIHDLPKDDFFFYLGNLEPRKNLEGILKAFAKIKMLGFALVIGGAQGWLNKKIKKSLKTAGEKNNVQFAGYLNLAQASLCFNKAAALIWPSYFEGFGLPPIEAQAAKCAVIASANSSMSEVLQNKALLVDPHNINEITASLELIAKDEKLKKNFSGKSENIFSLYNWDIAAAKTLTALKSACDL